MTEITPLNPEGRDLLIHVEAIAEKVRRGEVVGLLSVLVMADSETVAEAAGLFYNGHTMFGALGKLQMDMLELENPTNFEVIIDE